MPAWIHSRAEHLLAKNPSMKKSVAFAIATQQGHKLGKNPKGYGTKKGKKEARQKFDKPRKEYVKGANPGDLETPKMPREKSKESAMRAELAKQATSQSDDPYMLDQVGKPKTRQRRADAPNPKYRVKQAMIPGAGQGPQSFGVPKNNAASPQKKLQQSQKIGVPKMTTPQVKPLQVKMAAFGPKIVGVRGGKNIPLEEFLAKAKGFGGRAKELLLGKRVGRLDAAKAKLQEALHHPSGAKAVMEKGDLVQGMLNPRVGIDQMRRMAKPVEAAMKETAERKSQIADISKDLAGEKLKALATQVGAAGAGGAALASPILVLNALNNRASKEKKAYATNQYSGNMGPGPLRNYAAGMPSYGVRGFSPGDPNTKTAGPPSEDTGPEPEGKVRGLIDKFFDKGKIERAGARGASAGDIRRAIFGWSEEDLEAAKRKGMSDELAKLNGVATTPKGKLYQGQAVGGPKVTAPHGPSIAEQSKPIGYGLKQPGAVKNTI